MTQAGSADNPRKILVDWANEQQSWVRTIVRLVLEMNHQLPESALDEIYTASLTERGLSDEPAIVEGKLALDIGSAETVDRLTLASVKNVRGVNLLAPSQEILFNGRMTVLFGENAAGKTGYVRIFKRAAAVRSAEMVLPNVQSTSPEAPHATISYKHGNTTNTCEWNNEAGIAPLVRLSIFDSRAVSFHVDSDLEYVYVPHDLALFPFISEAIQGIRDRLARARDTTQPSGNPFLHHFTTESPVYGKLEAIGPTTDLSELESAAKVSAEEKARLPLLRDRVQALSAIASAAHLHSAKLERDFYSKIEAIAKAISTFDWQNYAVNVQAYQGAYERYKIATERAFAGIELPGALTDAWHKFIVSGEELIKTLDRADYPRANDSCVYCSQALNNAAVLLLRKYRDYCNNEVKADLDSSRSKVLQQGLPVTETDIRDLERSLSSRITAEGESVEWKTLFDDGLALVQRYKAVLKRMTDCASVESEVIVETASTLANQSAVRFAQAHAAVIDLEKKGAEREKALKEATLELASLEDRITLTGLLPAIRQFVDSAKWASKATTILTSRFPPLLKSLTDASKEASEDLLNRNFVQNFQDECKALRTPTVKLEFPGRAGQAMRRKSIVAEHRLSDVLSEGEQKVIALADFLAEAAIRSTSSPLIFDDPVNSLDYKRLQHISDRLYELSAEHQVIVFTHNIWLATALLAKFEKHPDDCFYYEVSVGEGGTSGHITRGKHPRYDVPNKLGPRINEIIQSAQASAGETREALIASAYSTLRSWCEAVVEQDLFQSVTQRYQPHIRMTNLSKIKTDRLKMAIDAITGIFEKCCRITDAHSQPLETLNVRPTLDQLKQDWSCAQEARGKYNAN